ncbi:MAG: hypothetical protein ACKN9T_07785 [Candidatus Methylumidiphilus sp.]
MNKGFILHAALLAGNIGLFIAISQGHSVFGIPAAQQTASASPAGAFSQSLPATEGGLAASLEMLRQEQALVRAELKRLQHRPVAASAGDSSCADAGDNAPGVTVYLDTSQAQTPQTGRRQWTAVSFKDIGPAPDGSKQAVMSIKTEQQAEPVGLTPTRSAPRWQ